MGERKVNQPLPEKIERRLAELLALDEFDEGEVTWCRRSYWDARDDWHKILVACYDMTQRRTSTTAE
ncbi:hypothetical protein [Massilia sp. DWR3-1-1]|uniref:hypothetical protein n=1 Tax=Massilia sp. DWR3-1-1 TaxID=2804559 RepID=UPI003CF6C3DA